MVRPITPARLSAMGGASPFCGGTLASTHRMTVVARMIVPARRTKAPPRPEDVQRASEDLASEDAGLRADAARLLRTWAARDDAPTEALDVALARLDAVLEGESDPFVRAAGQRGDPGR